MLHLCGTSDLFLLDLIKKHLVIQTCPRCFVTVVQKLSLVFSLFLSVSNTGPLVFEPYLQPVFDGGEEASHIYSCHLHI